MCCFQFEPWCIVVKKKQKTRTHLDEHHNLFKRLGSLHFFFFATNWSVYRLWQKNSSTFGAQVPTIPLVHECTYTHTNTHCLNCIQLHANHCCTTSVLLDNTTHFVRQSFMLDIQACVLGILAANSLYKDKRRKKLHTRYMSAQRGLKTSLPMNINTRNLCGQCSGEQRYTG